MTNHYDAIIIGAGMSGLAAGIRLAMFDKKVLILEKHVIPGGLNSYYQRRNRELGGTRQFDVGLHALTNFAKKGERKKPLTKLLKQLRFSYDDLKLHEQSHSLIHFPETILKFNNDFEILKSEIEIKFPDQKDGFYKLLEKITTFDELNLNQGYSPSKSVLEQYLSDPLLVQMLLCPLLIYGSAWEDDMDFAQFVIMFKSIYIEGFSRPENGVRTIIDMLTEKYKAVGGELNYREGVEQIITKNNSCVGIKSKKNEYTADRIFSSAGLPETISLCDGAKLEKMPAIGDMSFMETIFITDKKVRTPEFDSTIIFYNDSNNYHYKKSEGLFDSRSAVFCCPDNYELDNRDGEGTFRVTFMANYEKWKALEKTQYKEQKEIVNTESLKLIKKLVPNFDYDVRFSDIFSPTTVERYTSHFNGTVYGSTDKSRDGKTPIDNLFIIGTDQGFLGIIGSMLSGISIANLYGLMESK
jgi:phytoene dehydrogenase-like protein